MIFLIFLSQHAKRIISQSLLHIISGYKEESSTSTSYKTSKSTRPPINKELDKDIDTNKGRKYLLHYKNTYTHNDSLIFYISCSQFKSVPLTGKTSSVKNTQKESESKHKSLPISSKPPDRSTSSSAISTQPKSTTLQQKDKERSDRTKDGSVKYETDRSKSSSNKVRLFTNNIIKNIRKFKHSRNRLHQTLIKMILGPKR